MDIVSDEIRALMPYKIIQVERAEADDIIGTLALASKKPVMIVSGDKDFQQLQMQKNIRQYAPVKGVLLQPKDARLFLKEQIIRGDSGDDVPNILSDDDVFVVPGKRQKSIREVKLKDWLMQAFEQFAEPERIERNKTMIDLTEVPKEIKIDILHAYKDANINSRQLMLKYFMEKRLTNLLTEIDIF